MSGACKNGGPAPLLGMRFGSVPSVTTATVSPGRGCPDWSPIQASSLLAYARSFVPHIGNGLVVLATISAVVFTFIIYASSFITSASDDSYVFSYYFYPIETFRDLVFSTLLILNDEFGIIGQHERFQCREPLHRPIPLIAKPDSFVVRRVKK